MSNSFNVFIRMWDILLSTWEQNFQQWQRTLKKLVFYYAKPIIPDDLKQQCLSNTSKMSSLNYDNEVIFLAKDSNNFEA